MGSVAEDFFSTGEQQEICEAVHAAEQRTSGEIVPMVVSESGRYSLAVVRGSVTVALVLALLLTGPIADMFWLNETNMWIFLGLFTSLFVGCQFLINAVPGLKRRLLFDDEMATEVRDAAFAAFFSERLHKTRDSNGILIFISLLEHRAWVIADSGISDRIPCQQWEEAVAVVTRGIREKNQCQALCRAIEMVGDILEKEFPVRDDDQNELHDLIIR